MQQVEKQQDRRVSIHEVNNGPYKMMFYYGWDTGNYGICLSYRSANGTVILDDCLCPFENLPEPELPDKRLVDAFPKAFNDYATGKATPDIEKFFAPKAHSIALEWARPHFEELQKDLDAKLVSFAAAMPDYSAN